LERGGSFSIAWAIHRLKFGPVAEDEEEDFFGMGRIWVVVDSTQKAPLQYDSHFALHNRNMIHIFVLL
jgi:hypothetical protein